MYSFCYGSFASLDFLTLCRGTDRPSGKIIAFRRARGFASTCQSSPISRISHHTTLLRNRILLSPLASLLSPIPRENHPYDARHSPSPSWAAQGLLLRTRTATNPRENFRFRAGGSAIYEQEGAVVVFLLFRFLFLCDSWRCSVLWGKAARRKWFGNVSWQRATDADDVCFGIRSKPPL